MRLPRDAVDELVLKNRCGLVQAQNDLCMLVSLWNAAQVRVRNAVERVDSVAERTLQQSAHGQREYFIAVFGHIMVDAALADAKVQAGPGAVAEDTLLVAEDLFRQKGGVLYHYAMILHPVLLSQYKLSSISGIPVQRVLSCARHLLRRYILSMHPDLQVEEDMPV